MPPKRYQPEKYQPKHARRSFPVPKGVWIALAVVLLFMGYLLLEPKLLQVEKHTVVTSALSGDVKQLRIVYVSDIHQGSWPYLTQADVDNLVSRINAQNADLVLLGGDYAQDSDGAVAFFKQLSTIRASYGVYGVLGNHDRTLPESNLAQVRSAMIRAGVTLIVNEVTTVRVGKQDIYLAGLDDVNNGWPDLAGVAAQCRQSDLVIFLCHSPAIVEEALTALDADGRKGWFDLGLFGHTHGGQVAIFGSLFGLHRTEGAYTSGWYSPGRTTTLLVSRGAGTSGLPFRLGRRPQMHVITLKSEE